MRNGLIILAIILLSIVDAEAMPIHGIQITCMEEVGVFKVETLDFDNEDIMKKPNIKRNWEKAKIAVNTDGKDWAFKCNVGEGFKGTVNITDYLNVNFRSISYAHLRLWYGNKLIYNDNAYSNEDSSKLDSIKYNGGNIYICQNITSRYGCDYYAELSAYEINNPNKYSDEIYKQLPLDIFLMKKEAAGQLEGRSKNIENFKKIIIEGNLWH